MQERQLFRLAERNLHESLDAIEFPLELAVVGHLLFPD